MALALKEQKSIDLGLTRQLQVSPTVESWSLIVTLILILIIAVICATTKIRKTPPVVISHTVRLTSGALVAVPHGSDSR